MLQLAIAADIAIGFVVRQDAALYQDLGANHFQSRSTGQHTQRLVKRLADLGYDVALTPLANEQSGARGGVVSL